VTDNMVLLSRLSASFETNSSTQRLKSTRSNNASSGKGRLLPHAPSPIYQPAYASFSLISTMTASYLTSEPLRVFLQRPVGTVPQLLLTNAEWGLESSS
jgi:hypothetical protein